MPRRETVVGSGTKAMVSRAVPLLGSPTGPFPDPIARSSNVAPCWAKSIVPIPDHEIISPTVAAYAGELTPKTSPSLGLVKVVSAKLSPSIGTLLAVLRFETAPLPDTISNWPEADVLIASNDGRLA